MGVVVRGRLTQTEVQVGDNVRWHRNCVSWRQLIDTTAVPSTLLPNVGIAEPSALLCPHIPPALPRSSSFWPRTLLPNSLFQPLSDRPPLGSSFRALLQLCPQYSHIYLHSNNSHSLVSTYYVPGTRLGILPAYNLEFTNLETTVTLIYTGRNEGLEKLGDVQRDTTARG